MAARLSMATAMQYILRAHQQRHGDNGPAEAAQARSRDAVHPCWLVVTRVHHEDFPAVKERGGTEGRRMTRPLDVIPTGLV
jgi:hypothetical protein